MGIDVGIGIHDTANRLVNVCWFEVQGVEVELVLDIWITMNFMVYPCDALIPGDSLTTVNLLNTCEYRLLRYHTHLSRI